MTAKELKDRLANIPDNVELDAFISGDDKWNCRCFFIYAGKTEIFKHDVDDEIRSYEFH